MRVSRQARSQAKSLFRTCLVDGKIDESRVRKIGSHIASTKPRNAVAILSWFHKLLQAETEKRSYIVESAVPLADGGASVFAELERKFGPALSKTTRVNPDLIGGLRIRVGSDVWDGSIRQRLHVLESSIR
jgi:F-type H+-transporting ATPase subunit delta